VLFVRLCAAAVLFGVSASRAAEKSSPLNAGLREGVELFVTCALNEAPRLGEVPVLESKAEREAAKGVYHYKLWLPPGYLSQTKRRWPCLFIASPAGNAKMGNMRARLTNGNYVVVLLEESRNGPWAPAIGNFLAAHDDVVRRVRLQEGAKVATGFSGGARASSIFVQLRPGFAGAILQGAGVGRLDDGWPCFDGLVRNQALAIAMIVGRGDPRRTEMEEMEDRLGPKRFAAFVFPGGHQWAPVRSFDEALDWLETIRPILRREAQAAPSTPQIFSTASASFFPSPPQNKFSARSRGIIFRDEPYFFPPATRKIMPPTTQTPPTMGPTGTRCSFSLLISTGPILATFSFVV
jgi:hypothetical protein